MKTIILTTGLAVCLVLSVAHSLRLRSQLKIARHTSEHECEKFDEKFDRRERIQSVARGDKDAAFDLGRYYGDIGIYEASWYWFQTALDLGHQGLTQEVVDGVKKGIINSELGHIPNTHN